MSKKSTISKRVADLIATATPKQKALLVCKQHTEENMMNDRPLLTDEEVKAVLDSLKTADEAREYNKYITCFNVYNDFSTLFGVVYKEYQVEAERALGYLRQWEAYDQEENHLIAVYESLREAQGEAAAEAFLSSLSYLTFKDAKLVIAEDGYPEINIDPLYKRIEEQLKEVWIAYDVAKSIVIVMDEYTKRTRSADFRPEIMKESVKNIKSDYSQRVAPRYSRKLLKERQERGATVTADEKRRAVYPYYEEIKPSETYLNLFRNRLDAIVKSHER